MIYFLHFNPVKAADSIYVGCRAEALTYLGHMWSTFIRNRATQPFDDGILYYDTTWATPLNEWLSESVSNYSWAYDYTAYLLNDWKRRHLGPHHITDIFTHLGTFVFDFDYIGLTMPPQLVPEDCKMPRPIGAWRKAFIELKGGRYDPEVDDIHHQENWYEDAPVFPVGSIYNSTHFD